MIEPAKCDDGVPTINWAEKDWPIPLLAAKQLDVVWEPIIALTEALRFETQEGETNDARNIRFSEKVLSLSGEQMHQLRDVVFAGLTRAHPTLTREEFDDVPISPMESVIAFFTVRTQSLIYGRPTKKADTSGEAEAAGNQTSSI